MGKKGKMEEEDFTFYLYFSLSKSFLIDDELSFYKFEFVLCPYFYLSP